MPPGEQLYMRIAQSANSAIRVIRKICVYENIDFHTTYPVIRTDLRLSAIGNKNTCDCSPSRKTNSW